MNLTPQTLPTKDIQSIGKVSSHNIFLYKPLRYGVNAKIHYQALLSSPTCEPFNERAWVRG